MGCRAGHYCCAGLLGVGSILCRPPQASVCVNTIATHFQFAPRGQHGNGSVCSPPSIPSSSTIVSHFAFAFPCPQKGPRRGFPGCAPVREPLKECICRGREVPNLMKWSKASKCLVRLAAHRYPGTHSRCHVLLGCGTRPVPVRKAK